MAKPHDWALSWPGNYCKDCGCDDPGEMCMGGCAQAPSDENGYPDVMKCPVHGLKSGLWHCKVPEGEGYHG